MYIEIVLLRSQSQDSNAAIMSAFDIPALMKNRPFDDELDLLLHSCGSELRYNDEKRDL